MSNTLGVTIQETMSGWVQWEGESGRHPLSFTASIWSSHLWQWWKARKLSGVVQCPGRFPSVAAEGTVFTLPPRGVEYELFFHDPHLGRLRLFGKKRYSLKNLKASLTVLPAVVEDAQGRVVGRSELVYRAPLIQFVTDLRLQSQQHVEAPMASLKRPVLALAETLAPELIDNPSKQDAIWQRFTTLMSLIPHAERKYLRVFYQLLAALGLLKGKTSLEQLSPEERRGVLDRLQRQGYLPRKLVEVVQIPVRLAMYRDEEFYKQHRLEIPPEPVVAAEPAPWQQNLFVPSREWSESPLECDVVIVGTGAGGAVVAESLAKRGIGVVLVEEGAYWDRPALQNPSLERFAHIYRSFMTQRTSGTPPILLPTGIGVGGTTLVKSGSCYRTPSWILERWRRELQLEGLTPEALKPYFEKVEAQLKVQPPDPAYLGPIADIVAQGARKLGYQHHPIHRNAEGCNGQAVCWAGCPIGAKNSTHISFIPSALRSGASLFTGYRAYDILQEQGRAVGLRAEVPGFDHSWDIEIRAKCVVLAAGTLLTPQLLVQNGISADHPQMGRNLSIHPTLNIGGLYRQPMQVARYVPQSYAIDHFCEEGLMFEGATTPPELTAASLPVFGAEFQHYMRNYSQYGNFGFMVRDTTLGHLRFSPGKPASIRYQIDREGLRQFTRGVQILGQVLLEGGAEELLVPVAGRERICSQAELQKKFSTPIRKQEVTLTAYHPLGTCRLGHSAQTSVISPEHEVWGMKNLFVTDGSAVPGPLGVNPQITIMALAMRAAEFVGARI